MAAVAAEAVSCLFRSRHSPLIRPRTRCRPASPFRSSGRNLPHMAWCSLWRANWGSASSARSTTGSAILMSRTVAPLRLRSLPAADRDFSRSTCRPQAGGGAVPEPGLCPARSFRLQSGAASSAKRSTTTIKPSPPPAPAAIWEASRGGIDLLRGSLIAGSGYERAGLYEALMATCTPLNVNGLVTQSGGDRLCPQPHRIDEPQLLVGGRLLDAYRARRLVSRRRAARTWYYGSASTQFARA